MLHSGITTRLPTIHSDHHRLQGRPLLADVRPLGLHRQQTGPASTTTPPTHPSSSRQVQVHWENPKPRNTHRRAAFLHDWLLLPTPDRGGYLEKAHAFDNNGTDGMASKLMADCIHWPGMHRDATLLVQHCMPCQRHNIEKHGYHPFQSVLSAEPMHVCDDLNTNLAKSPDGHNYVYILVAIFYHATSGSAPCETKLPPLSRSSYC
jgi:hypothetical protein